jgi:hypothetical protein
MTSRATGAAGLKERTLPGAEFRPLDEEWRLYTDAFFSSPYIYGLSLCTHFHLFLTPPVRPTENLYSKIKINHVGPISGRPYDPPHSLN